MNNINNIIRDLNIVSVKGRKRYYTLSYGLQIKDSDKKLYDPQKMDSEDVMWYVVRNYKEKKNFDKNKLINDLIIFKSYKDDLEQKRLLQNTFSVFFTGIITMVTALISINFVLKDFDYKTSNGYHEFPKHEIPMGPPPMEQLPAPPEGPPPVDSNLLMQIIEYLKSIIVRIKRFINESIILLEKNLDLIGKFLKKELKNLFIKLEDWKEVIFIIAICIIATFIYYLLATRKKSSYNKIKTLNNVIYYLEEINKSLE
ncbi:hypothetical protein [Peptoniphilus harei]|uniref:hypothetical protein n=1 Tax=Peptoniphilus harei TaxID=54005 RepID=UPI0039842FA7